MTKQNWMIMLEEDTLEYESASIKKEGGTLAIIQHDEIVAMYTMANIIGVHSADANFKVKSGGHSHVKFCSSCKCLNAEAFRMFRIRISTECKDCGNHDTYRQGMYEIFD